MTASLHHRGPDAQSAWLLDGAALGHTRLSIVDISAGHQPMADAATGVTVIFNGEIFNHVELREKLSSSYAFRTRSDTEVILAGFLKHGIRCVEDFIGQWAFAIFDPRDGTLWLSRDRVGIRPLYYAQTNEGLAFASEVRALYAAKWLEPRFDAKGIKDTLTLWVPGPPRSNFEGVQMLPAGTTARFKDGKLDIARFWDVKLEDSRPGNDVPGKSEKDVVEEFGALLEDAVRLRLRADVPVAAYLSGGLDSSVICAIAQKQLGGTLSTFSLGFPNPVYDERGFQEEVARSLGTKHHSVVARDEDTAEWLPTVVSHTEQVLLRAAPAPLFTLSKLVRSHETKVVLTGEGADEMLWGYDLYKETKVRQFWARQPQSKARSALFRRLYPYLPLRQQSPELLGQFFGIGLDTPNHPAFSHLIRWSNSGRITRFLAPGFSQQVAGHDPVDSLIESLPQGFRSWRPLARAQYLEVHTLLSGYLLSAQGDRMLMGNSVEGRFPFLDHRVIEFAAKLPEGLKLRGLKEKYLLRRYAEGRVPASVLERDKQPYRAPVAQALAGASAPEWARTLLSKAEVDRIGVFDGSKVEKLVAKVGEKPREASEADSMALVAIASTQLLGQSHLQPQRIPDARLRNVELSAK